MSSLRPRFIVCGIVVLGSVCGPVPADAANKVAFVTSVIGKGDLSAWPDAGGQTGLAAADSICQARAAAGGLANPGDFIAWMSDSSDDAYCRVHGLTGMKSANCGQISLPVGAGPWVRTDGFPFGDTIEHLLSPEGAALVPIYLDEYGTGTLDPARDYFTNTDQFGEFDDSYTACADWTSSASTGVRGGRTVLTTTGWTDGITTFCNRDCGLLCMEKGAGDPMPDYASEGAVVFLTSVGGTGDLSSWLQAAGEEGAAAGDAICRKLAWDAGLPAAWDFRAWLSTAEPTPVNAVDRFYYDGPWVRLDGVPVATGKADLVDGQLFAPVNLGENGVYNSFWGVWTGTEQAGTASSLTCDDWDDGTVAYSGRRGTANYADSDWTDGSNGAATTRPAGSTASARRWSCSPTASSRATPGPGRRSVPRGSGGGGCYSAVPNIQSVCI